MHECITETQKTEERKIPFHFRGPNNLVNKTIKRHYNKKISLANIDTKSSQNICKYNPVTYKLNNTSWSHDIS